jgi:membrane peptidoglycan carboxypeptidase
VIAHHKFNIRVARGVFTSRWFTAAGRTEARSASRKSSLELKRRGSLKRLIPIIIVTVVGGWELRTSTLQALVFSSYANAVSFGIAPGQSSEIAFPINGPFDRHRGYTEIPHFVERLSAAGYQITEQARASAQLRTLVNWGISPPYDESTATGLEIWSKDGDLLYRASSGDRQFRNFDDIPIILLKSLLFIENRELELDDSSTVNPAIEWDRFGWAGLAFTGRKIGLPLPAEGGSTLAVQLEKYRHSPNGRTSSASDKLRQILAASLRVYRSGPDTQEERRKIVLEYMNTMPLAA